MPFIQTVSFGSHLDLFGTEYADDLRQGLHVIVSFEDWIVTREKRQEYDSNRPDVDGYS